MDNILIGVICAKIEKAPYEHGACERSEMQIHEYLILLFTQTMSKNRKITRNNKG